MNEGIIYGALLYAMSFTFYVKRRRVLDTPTAKALSAAIGRAEVAGRALGEPPSPALVSGTSSAYWEVRLYHRFKQGNRRRERCIATKNSVGGHFWIEDTSGRVPVLIDGAEWWLEKRKWRARKGEAIPERALAWVSALGVDWNKHDLRLEEECIEEGGPVYVLGTLSTAPDVLDPSARRRRGVRAFFTQLLTNPLQSGALADPLSAGIERLRAGTLQGQERLQNARRTAAMVARTRARGALARRATRSFRDLQQRRAAPGAAPRLVGYRHHRRRQRADARRHFRSAQVRRSCHDCRDHP